MYTYTSICIYASIYKQAKKLKINFTKSEIRMYKKTPVSKIDTRANRKIVILD